jgi:integrase
MVESTPAEIKTALDDFARYLFAKLGCRPVTVTNHVGVVRRFAATLGTSPTERQLQEYVANMMRSDASYSHVGNTCVAIERYTEMLGRPIKLGRTRKPSNLVRGALSEAEVGALIAAAKNSRDRTILILLAYTGMVSSELCNLRVCDIDLNSMNVTIRGAQTIRDRTLPLPAPCAAVLAKFLEERKGKPGDFVFITRRARGFYGPQNLRKLIRQCAEAAGIEKRVYPHLLRHSLATNLMHSGTGLLAIKQQLGHVYIETTMRYLHGDPERLKQEFLVHAPKYLPD